MRLYWYVSVYQPTDTFDLVLWYGYRSAAELHKAKHARCGQDR